MSESRDNVQISIESPRGAAAAGLIAELTAFLTPLYPEDVDDPPSPWTLDDLAAFVVARIDGVAAGCGGLAPLAAAGRLEIVRMYVRPGYRGQRIAEMILAELERLARARGAKVLMLRCGPRQPSALKLYERNGYTVRPPFAQHREHPTNIFYEKHL